MVKLTNKKRKWAIDQGILLSSCQMNLISVIILYWYSFRVF